MISALCAIMREWSRQSWMYVIAECVDHFIII